MKIFLVIYSAGQMIGAEPMDGMSMADCQLRAALVEFQLSLQLLEAATNPTPENKAMADSINRLTFVCEQR